MVDTFTWLLPLSSGAIGGGAVGISIGYAIKKLVNLVIGVIKVVGALFAGLFICGLTLLEYLGIITVNWNKIYALGPSDYALITSGLTWLQAQITPMTSEASAVAQTISGDSLLTGFAIGTVAGLYLGLKKAS
jgi:uncharacterized membrane protein (Fun14 family)